MLTATTDLMPRASSTFQKGKAARSVLQSGAVRPNELLLPSRAEWLHRKLNRSGGHAYVFATQGLDLAIPAQQTWFQPKSSIFAKSSCRDLASRLRACPTPPINSLSWLWAPGGARKLGTKAGRCCNTKATAGIGCTNGFRWRNVWYSHTDPDKAEAACAQVQCIGSGYVHGALHSAMCTTRIMAAREGEEPTRLRLPRAEQAAQTAKAESGTRWADEVYQRIARRVGGAGGRQKAQRTYDQIMRMPLGRRREAAETIAASMTSDGRQLSSSPPRPNLLLVLVDAVSRAELEVMMPLTYDLLEGRRFVRYSEYTAVGANSGPNQVALYQGRPLGAQSISSLQGRPWLWDTLGGDVRGIEPPTAPSPIITSQWAALKVQEGAPHLPPLVLDAMPGRPSAQTIVPGRCTEA